MKKTEKGRRAENAAVRYLESLGYVVLERNYRSSLGEIDIVAEDQGYLVFIEVRSRQGIRFGFPQETVNWAKQQRLRRLASAYLKDKGLWNKSCRFDVVGVLIGSNNKIKSIELIKAAF